MNHSETRYRFGLLAICLGVLLLFSGASAWAQSASGSISGIVTDPSGAAIVNASVRLIQAETNSSQTTNTNEAGRYSFISVQPGVYSLTVAHPGFTQARLQWPKVDVGTALTLNMTLEIGAASTVVEVKASAGAELQTLNATIGTTISREWLQLLPN